jgi:adenylate cyclase
VVDHAGERRLAAILAADVVGYSRLVGEDEAGTLAAVRKLRSEVIEPGIAEHKGRLFKVMGDGFLVEFPSVVNAVACAAAVQKTMAARNADIPEDQTVELRIGVHLGDVIAEGGDVYGDGVNIATRIEALAPPGGVAISAMVHDNIGNRLDFAFEDLGDQQLKNIARPIRIYRLTTASRPKAGTAHPERTKPSIAILPFTNMSGEVEQDYFSDGITEDIITELSRFRSLDVIARHSSFSFKGKSLTAQQIGLELGVNYILEGSVRRAGNRVRITAQLIDAKTSSHIWAERLDRELIDLFAMQDEVTERIVTTIADRLERTEKARVVGMRPDAMRAHDFVLQARSIISDTAEANLRSRHLYEKALEIEPHNVLALTGIAWSHLIDLGSRWNSATEQILDVAEEYVRRALEVDSTDYRVHSVLSSILRNRGLHDQALKHAEQAVSLNPNDAEGCVMLGSQLLRMGRPTDALTWISKAMRLNPFHPAWYLYSIGEAHYQARDYEQAIAPLKTAIARFPRFITPRRHLAATYAQLGRLEEARDEVATLLKIDPTLSISMYRQQLPYQRTEDRDHYLDGLRKAGLPE